MEKRPVVTSTSRPGYGRVTPVGSDLSGYALRTKTRYGAKEDLMREERSAKAVSDYCASILCCEIAHEPVLVSYAGIHVNVKNNRSGLSSRKHCESLSSSPNATRMILVQKGVMAKSNLLHILLAATLIVITCAASAGPPAKLARMFDPEMIDADVAYFEQVAGLPRRTFENTKSYKVDGCEVVATIARGAVRSLQLELGQDCTFDLNKFLPNYSGKFPPPHMMTVGQFDAITNRTGHFYSDCIHACGNAVDPSVVEHWIGSRADGFVEIMLEVVMRNDRAINAAFAWYDAMEEVEGKEWVVNEQWNCTRKHDATASRAFKDVGITSITIGYDVWAQELRRLTGPLFCKR